MVQVKNVLIGTSLFITEIEVIAVVIIWIIIFSYIGLFNLILQGASHKKQSKLK